MIGADSIVVRENVILEKPGSVKEAKEMLMSLSGTKHQVKTAVVFMAWHQNEIKCEQFVETTLVEFADLDPLLIDAYVASGEPMDKAGGYGYQGLARFLVPRIHGCYYNVVGFPAFSIYHKLNAFMGELE